jgi:uncharacterized protein (DUF849 family)
LQELFGRELVFNTPLSEDAMTGVAIGAAMAGMRSIHVHIRIADSEGCRSAFRTDVDHDSEVMPISVPK